MNLSELINDASILPPEELLPRLQSISSYIQLPTPHDPALVRSYGFFDRESALGATKSYLKDIQKYLADEKMYHVKQCLSGAIMCLRRHLHHYYCMECDIWIQNDRVVEGHYESLYHCGCHHIYEALEHCTNCSKVVFV